MEERRRARVGTVSGLALLTGSTALVAVAGGRHSIFATLLLGLLSVGMAHALVVEIQRQARRRTRIWGRHDSVNAILLAAWSACAVAIVLIPSASRVVQLLCAGLAAGYAAACVYFVVERRRSIVALPVALPAVPERAAEALKPEPAAPDRAPAPAPSVSDSAPSA